jgi:hypothetical protein
VTGPGGWWRSLDHDSPAFRSEDAGRGCLVAIVGGILLVIVTAVLIALEVGVAR